MKPKVSFIRCDRYELVGVKKCLRDLLASKTSDIEMITVSEAMPKITGFKLPRTQTPEMLGFPEILGGLFKEALTVKPLIDHS